MLFLVLDVEAVIKSAASGASRTPKSRNTGGQRTAAQHADGRGWLGSPGFLDFGLPGDRASSRLDQGFHVPSCTHAAQSISGTCNIEKYPALRMANRYTSLCSLCPHP